MLQKRNLRFPYYLHYFRNEILQSLCTYDIITEVLNRNSDNYTSKWIKLSPQLVYTIFRKSLVKSIFNDLLVFNVQSIGVT